MRQRRPTTYIFALSLLTVLFAYGPVEAQHPDLSEQASISVLTMLPGQELYSAWGHTAIRVLDPAIGVDQVYNYGTFDFATPNFYFKFARGQLDYQLTVEPFDLVLRSYAWQQRPVIEQILNLSREEMQRMFEFLEWNALPENRLYRYDFFFDNCSTRPREVVETGLQRGLEYGGDVWQQQTFRSHIRPYLIDRPFVQFGIDLLLGRPTDRVATADEETFLPLRLFHILEQERALRDDRWMPLVVRTDTLFWVEGADSRQAAWPWPAILLWTLFVAAVIRTASAFRANRHLTRWILLSDAVVLGMVGLIGFLVAFMWFGTEHAATEQNWNLMWAWPTHLVAAILLVARPHSELLRVYLFITAAISLLALVAWPFIPQAFHPATLPLLLLIALRAGHRAFRMGISSVSEPGALKEQIRVGQTAV